MSERITTTNMGERELTDEELATAEQISQQESEARRERIESVGIKHPLLKRIIAHGSFNRG
ncbi:MAG TPA: hypothetical protein VF401_02610 [Candidatus Saccharimonadales bacterium]